MTAIPATPHWTQTVDTLLGRWLKRARENQAQHWAAARYYENANYLLGIPVVILSSAVGTTVFATLQKQTQFQTQIAVGAISVLAAILASLQTFLHFSERAERHRAVAASYSAVRRRLEALLSLPIELRGSAVDVIQDLQKELNALSDRSPNVPNWIWRKVAADDDQSFFLSMMPAAPIPGAGGDKAASDPYPPTGNRS